MRRLTIVIATVLLAWAPASASASANRDSRVDDGLALLSSKACTGCHTTDGRRQVGPTFLGYFGSEVSVSIDGQQRTLRVDADHVRRAVRTPNADVAAGYPANTMPTIDVTDDELELIVAALEHLGSPDQVREREKTEGSILWVVLGVMAFVLGHLVLSSVPIRTRLTRALGPGGYMLGYSLYAAATLTWVIWAYIVAPYVPLWTPQLWTRWLPLACMPIVMVLMLGSFIPTGRPHGGMTSITRHPQLWAQGIWGLCHLPPNGDVATVAVFGGLAALSFAGMIHIELRKRATPDDKWRELVAETSVVPFGAVIRGDNKLSLAELALPVAVGLGSYGGFLYMHELVIGKSGFPY
jgi:uncharacterized membrane protein/cytochrome c551/c552